MCGPWVQIPHSPLAVTGILFYLQTQTKTYLRFDSERRLNDYNKIKSKGNNILLVLIEVSSRLSLSHSLSGFLIFQEVEVMEN